MVGRVIVIAGLMTGAGVLLVGVGVVLYSVPFDLASYAAWIGIFTAVFGVVSTIRPLKELRITRRRTGAAILGIGLLATLVSVFWPASITRVGVADRRLDDFLAEYQFSEYHEARTDAPLSAVTASLRQVSFADMPISDALVRIRALAGGTIEHRPADDTPILDLMLQPGSGFLELDVSDPSELVYGMVGAPWSHQAPPAVTTPAEFLAFDAPGEIRVAFNLRVEVADDGAVIVSTETRCLGNDARARALFARYWRLIYPGSAIIRRQWLDAIVSRAEAETFADDS